MGENSSELPLPEDASRDAAEGEESAPRPTSREGSTAPTSTSRPPERLIASGERAKGESAPDGELLPRMLGERYRLESLVAKGGMGRVYLATQLPLERQVAVKVLVAPPNVGGDFRRRFLLEASTCSRLSHPNIVVVHDYGEHEGELFMAMELLDGHPLNVVQKQLGPLSPVRVVRIGLQIARALRAAHRAGVAHRDLKPGNVFLLAQPLDNDEDTPVDVVKVLDFGLVKVYEDERSPLEADLTEGDILLGSPRYMSPEQVLCEAVDARSDIYSLGILLFSLACGRPPFVGRSPIDVLTAHLQQPTPTMDEVLALRSEGAPYPTSVALQAIIERCTKKKPDERYQSIDEVIAALKRARRDLGDLLVSDSFDAAGPLLVSGGLGARLAGEITPTPSPAPGLVIRGEPSSPTLAAPVRQEKPKARWPIALGLVLAVALVGGVAAYLMPGPVEPAVRAPVETPDVSVTILSQPPGAEVSSGGVVLGRTPLTRAMTPTPEGAERRFDLRLEGHQPAHVRGALVGEAVELSATLQHTPEESPPPPAAPPVLDEDDGSSSEAAPSARPASTARRGAGPGGQRRSASSRPANRPPSQATAPAVTTPTSPAARRGIEDIDRGSILVDEGGRRGSIPIVD